MISIVIAYYNRKELFHRTLQSITESICKDFEVIVVDDASREEERLEDLVDKFPFLKLIRVEKKDKWYKNSCIPYNMGIAKAKGDIIILQNPECLHTQDILTFVTERIDDSRYLTMSCYAINEDITKNILPFVNPLSLLEILPKQTVTNYLGWYNHSIYNPCYFHFCAALTKYNMNKLGGFDERFASGIGYEDNEFLERIKRTNLRMIIVDKVSVIHQWHPKVYDLDLSNEHRMLYNINAKLRAKVRREKEVVKVNNSYV
jgi:glycosyltransferase involved in cell wall biosynthesis